jgi:hypothetical protein
MPEQFPYPTDGWSTGKMRKKGDKWIPGDADIVEGARALGEQNPLIQSIEQQHQERMKVQGIPEKMKQYLPRSGVGQAEVRELEGLRKEKTQHLSDMMYAPKSKPISESMKSNPEGFITTTDHPGLSGLGSAFDIQPMPDMDGHVLVKPKEQQQVRV